MRRPHCNTVIRHYVPLTTALSLYRLQRLMQQFTAAWHRITRKPCCRRETARCRCKFRSIQCAGSCLFHLILIWQLKWPRLGAYVLTQLHERATVQKNLESRLEIIQGQTFWQKFHNSTYAVNSDLSLYPALFQRYYSFCALNSHFSILHSYST